jgi:hypothetical protein
MAKRSATDRGADYPKHRTTDYKIGGDGVPVLVYNARGGIYRCSEATEAPRLPEGAITGADRAMAGLTHDLHMITLYPGLNLLGEETRGRLALRKGYAKRVEEGELVELGELDAWPEIKPTRAKDFIRTSADANTLRAISTVELRDEVAKVLERQLAEITSDGGTRARARRLNAAHSSRE